MNIVLKIKALEMSVSTSRYSDSYLILKSFYYSLSLFFNRNINVKIGKITKTTQNIVAKPKLNFIIVVDTS